MNTLALRRPGIRQDDSRLALAALVFGALVIGTTPILVRLAACGPAAAGFWRLAFATPLLALMAAGRPDAAIGRPSPAYLVATQAEDGDWREEPFTGTGFPKVFYLKYHLYSLYFPLMALARYSAERYKP